MRKFDDLNEWERQGILTHLRKEGWKDCNYLPEDQHGLSKDGLGFMTKDLIVDDN